MGDLPLKVLLPAGSEDTSWYSILASAIQNALEAPPIVNPCSHATKTSAIVLSASRPLESKQVACGIIPRSLGFLKSRKKPDEGERQAAKLKAAVEQHE
ncbi:hypothetical protein BZA77DRAFT_358761 [Pyronema omphalodes]|nr:hypothetical protein BZA77DRAFT_358761 [Pyronema omphalodes]